MVITTLILSRTQHCDWLSHSTAVVTRKLHEWHENVLNKAISDNFPFNLTTGYVTWCQILQMMITNA